MKIIESIKEMLNPRWTLVYRPEKSKTGASHQIYQINNPHKALKLYNKLDHVGFVTETHNRGGRFRAFRFDRIVSLSRG